MRSSTIFWGLVLVLIGGLLLVDNLGLLPPGLNVWAIFWSLVLVMLGLSLLVRNLNRGVRHEAVREPLDGAQRATLRFKHGAGELVVGGGAEPDALFSGTFGGGVDASVRRGAEEATVELSAPTDAFPFFHFYGTGDMNWTVGLNPSIPLALFFEVGASRNRFLLAGLQVKELHLQTGASATEIEFPAQAGYTRATVRSGAASVEMRVPQGVAARIHATGGLASINVDPARFPRLGSEYRSPDYDTAANRLDLDIETGVGSVRVM